MMNDGLSAADVLALTKNSGVDATTAALLAREDDNNMWDNPKSFLVKK